MMKMIKKKQKVCRTSKTFGWHRGELCYIKGTFQFSRHILKYKYVINTKKMCFLEFDDENDEEEKDAHDEEKEDEAFK